MYDIFFLICKFCQGRPLFLAPGVEKLSSAIGPEISFLRGTRPQRRG